MSNDEKKEELRTLIEQMDDEQFDLLISFAKATIPEFLPLWEGAHHE